MFVVVVAGGGGGGGLLVDASSQQLRVVFTNWRVDSSTILAGYNMAIFPELHEPRHTFEAGMLSIAIPPRDTVVGN